VSTTGLVWFRRDLRVHDHPALNAAHRECDRVVPVFVLDRRLLGGRFPSANRAWFLHGCLAELREALRERGADLVIREGRPEEELPALARECGAEAVYFASDVSPFARARDRRVAEVLDARPQPGLFIADDLGALKPYSVFTPFHRAWQQLPRREVHGAPRALAFPDGVDVGRLRASPHPEAADPFPPGERAARERANRWFADGLGRYEERHDRLAGGTSELSPYLHFGCISPRELEARALERGGEAFARQLAWRDFYAHVLLHNPANTRRSHKPEYDRLEWDDDAELLDAWREGRTGYPVVDAAMRQLLHTGWMHNRGRLIAGAFLTKDLHLDWRHGEAHFMRHLLCGDEASNNGNWQWIASVGVDPAPYFRRMYNPMTQQRRHDPGGEYVRRWLPELRDVPLDKLAEPWTMSADEQAAANCEIGRDYPEPVVDHAAERQRAMARYGAVRG
jgi:deoxyribodipyrimidine photo-lyase